MAQNLCLKRGKAWKRLFNKAMRPRHDGHGLTICIAADANHNWPLRAKPCQIADQRITAPVGQAQINQHHIRAVDAQMGVSRMQRIHPAQPRTRPLAHQTQRVGCKTAVFHRKNRQPLQRQDRGYRRGRDRVAVQHTVQQAKRG